MSVQSFKVRATNFTFKRIVRAWCRLDDSVWEKFPQEGPYILAANHINFMEVPAMYLHLLPRPLSGFVKAESLENPYYGWVFNFWDGIPIHRGEADMSAVKAGLNALAEGRILVITPEGTRTGDGILIQGHPGIVTMALKAQVPILPVVYYGHEEVWENTKRLRRTDFHVNVGELFYLDPGGERVTKVVRQQMVDEIMYKMARMLPEKNRGYYADLSVATKKYIRHA